MSVESSHARGVRQVEFRLLQVSGLPNAAACISGVAPLRSANVHLGLREVSFDKGDISVANRLLELP